MRLILSGFALWVAVLAAPAARGQSASDKAAAETLFERGVDLLGGGDTAEACKKLEASQRLDSGLGTLLYLAECYERLGRVASAWATFREAESIASGRGDTGRAEVARERAKALEPRLPKLWIRVEGPLPDDLTITRNGQPVPSESWGLSIPVDPIDQTIEASAPGKETWTTTVSVPGEKAEVKVEIPPLMDAAPATEPPPAAGPPAMPAPNDDPMADSPASDRSPGKTQRTAGIITGSVGLATVVVGSVFGFRAKDKNDESKRFCRPDDESLCSRQGVSLRNDAQAAATISTVGLAVGGAALAAGVVVYLTAPSDDSPAEASAGRLRLSTDVSPGGARLTLGGGW